MRNYREYAADFETTIYEGQERTEVWAACLCEVNTDDVKLFNCLDAFMRYILSLDLDMIIYFHNMKFDGSFILNWLFDHGYHNGLTERTENARYKKFSDLTSKEFICVISDAGQWYKITLKNGNREIQIRDSLKKINMPIRDMPDTFNTSVRKTSIEYEGERYAGCDILPHEREYIENDTLILSESLEFIDKDKFGGKLTTGSMSLSDFKDMMFDNDDKEFIKVFPNLCYITREKSGYTKFDMIEDFDNADEYIRESYRGGWCYVNRYKQKKEISGGVVCDVNSLYPSMMHSSSGNKFPIGYPKFFKGDVPDIVKENDDLYYFIRIRCNFELKEGYLPFIQIKNDMRYKSTETLETSFRLDGKGRKIKYVYNEITRTYEYQTVTLTLTKTDFELFQKHYNISDLEFLDGCYFNTIFGIFDDYIDKWAAVKTHNKGGMRYIAKLHLNSLYGKFGTRPDTSFKIPYMYDGRLYFHTIKETSKQSAIYIPIASAITSYARRFTITAAQKNYHKGGKGFIYADTDSIHCDLDIKDIKGLEFDDTAFQKWKIERTWKKGYFVRAKTYIEINDDDINIKAAGMPENCKEMFKRSFIGDIPSPSECTDNEYRFYYDLDGQPIKRTFRDFDIGLTVPCKLIPKQIKGGCVLTETDFTMKENGWNL